MRIGDWSSDVCSSDLAAAARGHELGNHTLFHQCSGSGEDRDWVAPHRDLDSTPAARMRYQVLLANAMLAAIDGRHERTFTVPCGDAVADGGNYVDLVAPDFVAIKLGSGAVVPDMAQLDPHAVTVEAPVGATGAQLIALVEEAGRRGTMVNFTFHVIGGDHLSVSTAAHAELLDYLSRHRDEYWVRSAEHTSELQSLMRISYAVFCLKKQKEHL